MDNDVDILRVLWQLGMFTAADLRFSPVGEYCIENRGFAIEGATADFSGVEIRNLITGELLRGAVRIDYRSSDWRAQNTINEPQFDNVILHLVAVNDTQLLRNGRALLCCTLTPNAQLFDLYTRLPASCPAALSQMQSIERTEILTQLLDQRIARKTNEVLTVFGSVGSMWYEAAYICFMRAAGASSEQKADFESIARSMPYARLMRHFPEPQTVEALLLGQAGHLDVEMPDCYIETIQRIFIASRDSTGFLPPVVNWSNTRNRPTSAPALTLARVAAVLYCNENLFGDLLNFDHIDDLRNLFIADVSPYWETHSAPMKGEGATYGAFSRQKADLIIINFAIPLLFAQSALSGDKSYADRASAFYELLPAEVNTYTRYWSSPQWRPQSAYDSQAIVELGKEYCSAKRCATCPLGRHRIKEYHGKLNKKQM